MKTLRFKTTVKCVGCLSKITPFLNQEGLIQRWKVDLIHPDKILEVVADERLTAERVISLVEYAGYRAEILGS